MLSPTTGPVAKIDGIDGVLTTFRLEAVELVSIKAKGLLYTSVGWQQRVAASAYPRYLSNVVFIRPTAEILVAWVKYQKTLKIQTP